MAGIECLAKLNKEVFFMDAGDAKGSFYSESVIRFSNLPIKKKIQISILSLKFKFPANDSKQQIQISSSG